MLPNSETTFFKSTSKHFLSPSYSILAALIMTGST